MENQKSKNRKLTVKNQKFKVLVLILLAVCPYVFSQTVYNIVSYGAIGNGTFLNTNAINAAITACHANGGGRVVVPAGVFRSGTIYMKNNVELHLAMGATLLGSGNHNDYPKQPQPDYRTHLDPEGWFALIYGEGLTNIALTGYGTINGNGAALTGLPGSGSPTHADDMFGRPRAILFISCKQVRVEGLKFISSSAWMQHYLDCEDVLVDRIEVYNHANKNNDQIDIDGCRRFTLSNAILDSDDDGISLKSSGAAPSEDVTITNCVVSSRCNAIKAGTGSTGGFRNIVITNCVIKHTRDPRLTLFVGAPLNGISGISLQIVDGGVMEGVTISNIVMEDINCPLFIWLGNRGRPHTETAPTPPIGTIRNITISNIVAYNTGNTSNSISGIPGHYIENVTINNIQLINRGGLTSGEYVSSHRGVREYERGYPEADWDGNLPSYAFFIRHVKNLSIDNMMFGSNDDDPRIPVIAVNSERIRIGQSIFTGESEPSCFALMENVSEFEVEKPIGWGGNQVIKN